MSIDLTTLANARAWMNVDAAFTTNDGLISRLITSASSLFEQLVGRDMIRKSYVETFDGNDMALRTRQGLSPWVAGAYAGGAMGVIPHGWALILSNYPIIPGTFTLTVDGTSVPQGSNPNQDTQVDGWMIKEKYRVELLGSTYSFTRGIQNIVASYDAGYYVDAESGTIPSVSAYTIQTKQTFVSDIGVTFSGGAALTNVASNPAAGQYSVDSNGLYTFNSADAGKAVVLQYAAIPPDVEQAVCELVAYKYNARDHIGQRSKIIGSENVSFLTDPIPNTVQAVIDQHRRVQV